MNKFLTLFVLSLLMLGNQSRAMELEQRKNKLKATILEMAVLDSNVLSKLNTPLLNEFNSEDHADVLCAIICVTEPKICSCEIETLVKNNQFDVNGLDVFGFRPLTHATNNYLKGKNFAGKVENFTVVVTLLKLGANPHKKENNYTLFGTNNIYERLHNLLVKNTKAKELMELFDKYFPPKPFSAEWLLRENTN